MRTKHGLTWTIILLFTFRVLILHKTTLVAAFEPITMTSGIIATIAMIYGVSRKDVLNCQIQECCHDRNHKSILSDHVDLIGLAAKKTGAYIRYSGYDDLRADMLRSVHGQPFIIDPIYESIKAQLRAEKPPKALVMYFSGWTGTGKSFVSNLIAKNLYAYGEKSKFVRKIMASYDFPSVIDNNEDLEVYRRKLKDMIRTQVEICERSLFIIDEVDKLPQGIIDVLKPFVDYGARIDGNNYYKSIFILLSNTGGKQLNDYAYKMYQTGQKRDDPGMIKDLEEIMRVGSFNEDGGLRNSSMIDRYLIDVFVPFLPLERQHVKLCVRDEVSNLQLDKDTSREQAEQIEKLVDSVADDMSYTPPDLQLYSKSGCKQVHKRVVIAHRMIIKTGRM